MQKVAFALDVKDGWPPVGVEHVWCERNGSIYQLKNAPYFIKLAVDDKFSAEPDAVNDCVFEFTIEESAGHSLVWVIEQNGLELEPYEHELFRLGCSVECFPAFKLHSIDVPASAEHEAVNAIMDKLESLGFAMAFPVWRHE